MGAMGGGRIATRSIGTQRHFVHERPFPPPVKQRRDASDEKEKKNIQLATAGFVEVATDCRWSSADGILVWTMSFSKLISVGWWRRDDRDATAGFVRGTGEF